MKYNLALAYIFLLFCMLSSCIPPGESLDAEPTFDISDENLQMIADAGDERRIDLLKTYLSEPDPAKRYVATQSLGSIVAPDLLLQLQTILNEDISQHCRSNAAFALGQSGLPQAEQYLVTSFANQDTSNVNNDVRKQILEAVGKVGTEKSQKFIAEQSTYTAKHDQLLIGQARAIYQFGLRGIITAEGTEKMISLVMDKSNPDDVRVMAANYLYRFKSVDLSLHDEQLLQIVGEEQDPRINMCLVSAISRSGDIKLLPYILDIIRTAEDYRISVNGLKGLANYPYVAYKDSLQSYFAHDNHHIAQTAAEVISNNLDPADIRPVIRYCQGELPSAIKARLYAGVLKVVPYYFANTRKRVSDELQIEMTKANSSYVNADLINALSYDPFNYEVVYQKGIKSNDLVLVTSAVLSIANALKSDKFEKVYRTPKAVEKARTEILGYLLEVFQSENIGAMAAASGVLRDDELGFVEELESTDLLVQASQKLKLPEHLETKIEIEKTIAYFSKTDYKDIKVDYNHPIDWEVASSLTDSSQAYILTNKGSIEISFFTNKAPGSVANFVNLVELDFYDNKSFHRVVPNFVIQTGCPRGDGYGSLDYTIRSEFSDVHYDNGGYIGMASAGPDTESTQWFITHSPTPHLDGRYTIFGRVTDGMEVVHQIQQGDIIKDVRIVKK